MVTNGRTDDRVDRSQSVRSKGRQITGLTDFRAAQMEGRKYKFVDIAISQCNYS